jgi:hypothetical protein
MRHTGVRHTGVRDLLDRIGRWLAKLTSRLRQRLRSGIRLGWLLDRAGMDGLHRLRRQRFLFR